jgi:hypothetical protein
MSRCAKLPVVFAGLLSLPAPLPAAENVAFEARHQLVFALDVVLIGVICWYVAKHRCSNGRLFTAGTLAVLVTSFCNLVALTIGLLSGLPGPYFVGFLTAMVWVVMTAVATLALGLTAALVAFARKDERQAVLALFLSVTPYPLGLGSIYFSGYVLKPLGL